MHELTVSAGAIGDWRRRPKIFRHWLVLIRN